MEQPVICVIVPVYKAEATLPRCIESVLTQQLPGGLRLILVELSSKTLYENETNLYVGFKLSAGQIEFYNERTFANVRIGGNTQFVTILTFHRPISFIMLTKATLSK